jgi:hypothetical protein
MNNLKTVNLKTVNSKTVNYIIIALIIVIAILFLYNKQENLTPQSEEAIQNISKVYADKNNTVTFNNIRILGNIDISGNINSSGNVSATNINGLLVGGVSSLNKKYTINMQDNGDMGIYDNTAKSNVAALGINGIFGNNNNLVINGNIPNINVKNLQADNLQADKIKGMIVSANGRYRAYLQDNRDWCVGNLGGINTACSGGAIN